MNGKQTLAAHYWDPIWPQNETNLKKAVPELCLEPTFIENIYPSISVEKKNWYLQETSITAYSIHGVYKKNECPKIILREFFLRNQWMFGLKYCKSSTKSGERLLCKKCDAYVETFQKHRNNS